MIFIFVYDVNNASAVLQLILLADNTNAYNMYFLSLKDADCLADIPNTELDYLSIWVKANKLSLNLKKNQIYQDQKRRSINIQFLINGQNLDHVKETVFFGVTAGLKHRSQATGEVRSVTLSHVL